MTIWQAVCLYPKAIGWSVLLSTAIVMEGYDVRYGMRQSDGAYQITALWQAGLSNGANVGEILGLFINDIVSERYGYRRTMLASLAASVDFIFIPFFAQNIVSLEVRDILMGMPWGTTYINLIAVGVLRTLLQRADQWAYRIPFALQWMWPVPLIIGIFFAPESPWWLALYRLTCSSADGDFSVDQTIALMVHTDALDRKLTMGISYWDCFKGIDRRRTEIVCLTWAIQNLCGAAFMRYSTYFFQQAGLAAIYSFDMSMALYAVAILGVFISWFFMANFGRRTLYLGGLAAMFLLLLIIGFVAVGNPASGGWAIGSLLLAYTLFYDITVGTVAFSIVAEIPSSRLRTKTIVLGRNLYNVIGIINGAGFFWAGMCFLCMVWTYFRLPEPKGRTYEELDLLFEEKISARKFKATVMKIVKARAGFWMIGLFLGANVFTVGAAHQRSWTILTRMQT
ncbi:hypothetical protein BGW36DRAFT_398784 [Talaromyces proteolyticus]|uniref:Major facilitator superfamily (MFS) profile domain-containing protein n=1 Tax=Talaromyces proteolyticus TaxID=1131652 RepID=A0AAD4KTI4_9EURO|nr:uncharacterized protein BGW36DRAFT_398784 [Talaromyces proteolyticus]KAH8695585.1 hypothetical protein BGW36DRAFT_398784 [Talaromyces proteolyticus]